MKIRHFFEYLLFQLLGTLVRLLPLNMVQRFGAKAGEFLYSVAGFRKSVTLENLQRAFPEKSREELNQIARASFRSIGTALFEFLWFPHFTPDRLGEIARIEKPELLRDALARGKGMIILAAHFGNWELLAGSLYAELQSPLHIIVKPQSNVLVDKQINRWRTQLGNKVVPMGIAVREILRALQNGGIVGIAADQSAPKESIAVEFFGAKVPTYEGPAVFSLKTGAPIMIGFSIRQPDGTYRATFEEVPMRDLTAYNQESIVELTKRHVAITEKYIRQYPGQWMWMHKRWKHVPLKDTPKESSTP